MTIDCKLAKSVMENEEGLNHLWIKFTGPNQSEYKNVQINVIMPDGMFRLPNLNGHNEDEEGTIKLTKATDIILEIYTEDRIASGDRTITVDITYIDCRNQRNRVSIDIPVRIVPEDQIEAVVVDNEVVNLLKQLTSNQKSNERDEIDLIGTRPDPNAARNEYSYLEQKYRIDFQYK